MVRIRTAGGDVHYSRRYRNERGGNQGTVLMPLNFILLTHYVYLRGDPYRKHMLGVGELEPPHTPAWCAKSWAQQTIKEMTTVEDYSLRRSPGAKYVEMLTSQ